MAWRITLGLTLLHLFLVVMGATQMDMKGFGYAGKVIAYYGAITGSGSHFDFFAPSVGSPMRAVFEVKNGEDQVTLEGLGETDRELALRVGNIVDAFRDEIDNEKRRRLLAVSWSKYILTRYPAAQQLKVKLEQYNLPSLKDFEQGEKPKWDSLYSATFIRKGN